jgi:hypothetical protein
MPACPAEGAFGGRELFVDGDRRGLIERHFVTSGARLIDAVECRFGVDFGGVARKVDDAADRERNFTGLMTVASALGVAGPCRGGKAKCLLGWPDQWRTATVSLRFWVPTRRTRLARYACGGCARMLTAAEFEYAPGHRETPRGDRPVGSRPGSVWQRAAKRKMSALRKRLDKCPQLGRKTTG